MIDFSVLETVLTSVKTATDIAKVIKQSEISLEDAEIKLKIADLISTLADVKLELAHIQDVLREKDEKILSLENQLKLRKKLNYDGKCYWAENDDVPFCAVCHEKDSRHHHLTYFPKNAMGGERYYCKICKNMFHL